MKPLSNHTSFETAYIVDDYPYGLRLRCKRAHWVEYKKNKGFRFVTRTTNPKKGDMWNKPDAGTYCRFGMEMFLDEENHVSHRAITEYSEPEQVVDFLNTFPEANMVELKDWILLKWLYCKKFAEGKVVRTVNGVTQEFNERERQEHQKDFDSWSKAREILKVRCPEIKV
jgi:hypothetical protein